MAAVTCFVGLHFGHILLHFKVWCFLLLYNTYLLWANCVYFWNYVLVVWICLFSGIVFLTWILSLVGPKTEGAVVVHVCCSSSTIRICFSNTWYSLHYSYLFHSFVLVRSSILFPLTNGKVYQVFLPVNLCIQWAMHALQQEFQAWS